MDNLNTLKTMIDEFNHPYFEDNYLEARMVGVTDLKPLAKELCLVKAGIKELKLGDITIPSPREHFLTLARGFRTNLTGVRVRADGQ